MMQQQLTYKTECKHTLFILSYIEVGRVGNEGSVGCVGSEGSVGCVGSEGSVGNGSGKCGKCEIREV